MATRKKSDTGAYMSQYDTEVEQRLQALEKGLAECKASCQSHTHGGGTDAEALHQIKNEIFEARQGMAGADTVNARIDALVAQLKKSLNYFSEV